MARTQQQGGRIIGIDLGTTNSVVAVMDGDRPIVIPNAEGGRVTPSVVAFSPKGELLVGQLARRQAILHPKRTIASIKRKMGTSATITIDDQTYTPQQISAMILKKLKQDTEKYLGEQVDRAVITVPAYFNDAQRQATKEAGQLAGLDVVRIINEPTAAALAYGLDKAHRELILVWDLGGGTFDVSLLDVGDGIFEVRSTSGDTFLGGDDFDHRIVEYLVNLFKQDQNIDLHQDAQALQRLLDAAERAKIELSSLTSTTIALPFLYADANGPHHLETELTRNQFETMTADLIARTKIPFQQALADAHIDMGDLHQVVLVGGATRMPAIGNLVTQLTGRAPNQGINPDEVVALGAAIQGGVLSGALDEVLLLDVTPLSLGVEIVNGQVFRLIERNTPLPIRHTEEFTTSYDNQPDVEVHVVQGESASAQANYSLGRFRLDGIPPAPRGKPRIAVMFDIDVNGMVRVSATDTTTGNSQQIALIARGVMPDVSPSVEPPHTGTHPRITIDANAGPQFTSETTQRADRCMMQGKQLLAAVNPSLSPLERMAVESAVKRLQQERVLQPAREQELALACLDFERLCQSLLHRPDITTSTLTER